MAADSLKNAPSLKDNSLYQKVHPNFSKSGFQEPLTTVQGFILGLLARDHTSSDKKTLELVTSVLNSGEALSGSGIALFTTMLIEEERELKSKSLSLFVPSQGEGSQSERVQALVDIAYGFTLGFCGESQPIAGSIVQMNYKALNDELREHLNLIEDLVHIDAASGASEEDIKLVNETLSTTIVRLSELMAS